MITIGSVHNRFRKNTIRFWKKVFYNKPDGINIVLSEATPTYVYKKRKKRSEIANYLLKSIITHGTKI